MSLSYVDGSKNLYIGAISSTFESDGGYTSGLISTLEHSTGGFNVIAALSVGTAAAMALVSSNGTLSVPTKSLNQDEIGELDFWGYNDVDGYTAGMFVYAQAEGDWTGHENYPMSLHFGNYALGDLVVIQNSGLLDVLKGMKVTGNVGFFGTTPIAKPTVTGSKASGAAYASLLTQLAALGLVTDSSTT